MENPFPQQLQVIKKFFDTATAGLDETDADFAPRPEMFTVAVQVAHVAQTVDWFVEGGFGEGWKMDFGEADAALRKDVTSLADARARLDRAFENAAQVIGSKTMAELREPFPPDSPIMAGLPRMAIVDGINEHTAHHRGALSVYARLRGKVPAVPYT